MKRWQRRVLFALWFACAAWGTLGSLEMAIETRLLVWEVWFLVALVVAIIGTLGYRGMAREAAENERLREQRKRLAQWNRENGITVPDDEEE